MNRCLFNSISRASTWLIPLAALPWAAAGCNSAPEVDLREIAAVPEVDRDVEFSLGSYSIPIPASLSDGRRRNVMQLKFDLHAVIAPKDEIKVRDVWSHHEGKFRDSVITICRRASLEDLGEPKLATLKSHLRAAARQLMGETRIRQIVIGEVISEPL